MSHVEFIFAEPCVAAATSSQNGGTDEHTQEAVDTLRGPALCVGLGASLSASAAPNSSRATGGTLAIIPAVAANPAQQAIVIGFKKQAKKLGYPSVMLGGEFDPQAQITAVNAAIQRKVAVLAIWPLDPKGIQPSLDRRRRQPGSRFSRSGSPVASASASELPVRRRRRDRAKSWRHLRRPRSRRTAKRATSGSSRASRSSRS